MCSDDSARNINIMNFHETAHRSDSNIIKAACQLKRRTEVSGAAFGAKGAGSGIAESVS